LVQDLMVPAPLPGHAEARTRPAPPLLGAGQRL